jgi:hypothetical protein
VFNETPSSSSLSRSREPQQQHLENLSAASAAADTAVTTVVHVAQPNEVSRDGVCGCGLITGIKSLSLSLLCSALCYIYPKFFLLSMCFTPITAEHLTPQANHNV